MLGECIGPRCLVRRESVPSSCGRPGAASEVAKEVLMRVVALTMIALVTAFAVTRASGQTYSPDYPVCLHVYGRVGYFDCHYTSIAQCKISASGISADCEVNPYFANAGVGVPPHRHHRRRAY